MANDLNSRFPPKTDPPLAGTRHIMIIAGEASGDAHASHLVRAIKTLAPEVVFSGLGGPKMKEAGVKIDEDLTRFAVVGFVEVLKHYKDFKRCFNLFLEKVKERNPVAVILVDYPGFNLRLAAALKKMRVPDFGGKVIYYISPQVWAWKANRVQAIKKSVDRMLVLFQFEKNFYWERGMTVDFVGHPLVDSVKVTASREQILNTSGLSADKITIGILPGSRQKEVESLFPPMLEAAAILRSQNPAIQFLVLKAPGLADGLFENILGQRSLPLKILEGNYYNGINACDLCMVASGTATLETAILNKPMVVVYKTSLLTWLLAKALIKISYIGLVNVVAGEKIVPECIQFEATGENIAKELRRIYQSPDEMSRMITALRRIRSSLGATGASLRAAEVVMKELGK